MNWREKAPPAAKLLVGEIITLTFIFDKLSNGENRNFLRHFDFFYIQTSKSRDLDLDLKMKNRAPWG